MRSKLVVILLTIGLLAGSFACFQFTDADVRLQDRLFDFSRQTWRVDKRAAAPRLIFYTGPKVLIILLGAGLLVLALLPASRRPHWLTTAGQRGRLWCVIACLAAVPGIIGLMKSRSDMYCPWDLDRYGGTQPYHHFFDPLPPGMRPDCGRCFPAGHASGGFALMSLGLLYEDSRRRWLGWALGLATGWMMGIYQMLKGAHFLSHTVTTMLLAIVIIQVLALVFERFGRRRLGSNVAGREPRPQN